MPDHDEPNDASKDWAEGLKAATPTAAEAMSNTQALGGLLKKANALSESNPDEVVIPTGMERINVGSTDDPGATMDVPDSGEGRVAAALKRYDDYRHPEGALDVPDGRVVVAKELAPAVRRFLAERSAPWERTSNWERKYELLHGRYSEMLPLFESVTSALEVGALDTIVALHKQLEASRSAGDRRSAGAYNAVESHRHKVTQLETVVQQKVSEIHSIQHQARVQEQQHERELAAAVHRYDELLARKSWIKRLFRHGDR